MRALKKSLLKEKKYNNKRYGLLRNDEITQRELADGMGISRSYVSRIEKEALNKLKTILIDKS